MVNIAPIHLLILLPLLPMMLSDWKSRTVSTGWLVLLFVLAGGCSVYANGLPRALTNTGLNLSILLVLGLALWAYAKLRGKRLAEMGGLGDLLFFAAITPLLSPEDYIRLMIAMLVFSLVLWALLKKRFHLETIPLVTFCGLPLMIWILVGLI